MRTSFSSIASSFAFILVTALATACSSATGAPVTAIGNVGEMTLDAKDGVAQKLFGNGVAIAIVDFAGACAGGAQANGTALNLLVNSSAGAPLVPATYDVRSLGAAAAVTQLDDQCVPSESGPATGGTITIDSISDASIRGSYDVTFRDGEIHGTFDVPFCAGSQGTLDHTTCRS